MSDQTLQPGDPASMRIDASDDDEVRGWAEKFEVTREQLIAAVKEVGDSADDVATHLDRQRQLQREIDSEDAQLRHESAM